MRDWVNMALLSMEEAGLNMFKREITPGMVTGFCVAIEEREADPVYIERAARSFIARNPDFPTPSEFVDRMKYLAEKDADKAAKRMVEASALPADTGYGERKQEPSVPATPEQRAEIRRRMESLGKRMELQTEAGKPLEDQIKEVTEDE